jgi:hypothetical protein
MFHPSPDGAEEQEPGVRSGSMFWAQTALGRRSEIRWPASISLFDVWSDDTQLELADFSACGLGVVYLREGAPALGHRVDLELRRGGTPFARVCLEITHAAEAPSGRLLGGRLAHSSVVPAARPVQTVREQDDALAVRDPTLSALVVARLGALGASAKIRLAGDRAAEVRLAPHETPETLKIAVSPDEAGALVAANGRRVTVEAAVGGGSFVLHAGLQKAGEDWALVPPMDVFSVGRRRCERTTVEESRAFVEWRHPLDPSRWITAQVRDISPGGLGIDAPADPAWLVPPPGVPVRLRMGDLAFPIQVEVRRDIAGSGSRIGLQMISDDAKDRVLLARAYQRARWPALGLRGEADEAAIDELMQASGYTMLRSGTEPVVGWHTPPGDERLTVDLVYRSEEGQLLGHVSCLRVYPKTWIYHQLATLPLARQKVAYSLYVLLAEWALALANGPGFGVAYFDQAKRWHKTMFADFVRWAGSESLSVIASLDRLERSPGKDRQLVNDPSIEVRLAEGFDRAWIVGLARASLPRLTADALHIHEDSVMTSELCFEHTAVGLERARTALVVELHGKPVGVALCETGSRRLSLFNILNMAHVFFSGVSEESPATAVQAALLASVLTYYECRGVLDPLVVTPSGAVHSPEASGLVVAETMGLWAASADGLTQWRNYIHLELGARATPGANAAGFTTEGVVQ